MAEPSAHEILDTLEAELAERVHKQLSEWQRRLSPKGLDHALKTVAAINGLGKGPGVVDAWLAAVTPISQEVGEDALPELAAMAMALASKTSGAVIERMLQTAPIAARRLADSALFLQYLQFVNTMAAQVPRALRPMLDQLEMLLQQLTLGGLRRWANWGAQAYRTDYVSQQAYFSLSSRESLAMLQQERKGTLLVDTQRQLNMYLRALWGRDFFLRPTAGDHEHREGYLPYIEDFFIHLPDAYDAVMLADGSQVSAVARYRAAAAHAAAHLVYTREPMPAISRDPWLMAIMNVLEDARVETLAISRFPGLQPLWASMQVVAAGQSPKALLARLAHALIAPDQVSTDAAIERVRQQWLGLLPEVHAQPGNPAVLVPLVNQATQWLDGRSFQVRRDTPQSPYRDDNRYTWAVSALDLEKSLLMPPAKATQQRRHVGLMEFCNELEVETAGDDANEIWVLGTELFPYEDEGVSFNQMEGKPPLAEPAHYPEWDYLIGLERPSWVTVQERHPALGDIGLADGIVEQHRHLIHQIRNRLEAMAPQGVQRIRKLEDGDDIDINAAVANRIDVRQRRQPDPRIMMRQIRHHRDVCVLVLLDLSASTNDLVAGQDYSVLDLTRQASMLLAEAIGRLGDPFAIHGFCSDGRNEVNYWRFKDFTQPYNDLVKARMVGMKGELSTRMGAAIRHATRALAQQPNRKRLLLVITDGEPADVDERDPQYLRHDARKAVEAAARAGVDSFCLSLDRQADDYVSRIFGTNHYLVMDHVQRLPERLPLLYAALTR